MDSLADHGYSGIDDGIKVHHFLQGIKSTELEAEVNVVWAQPKKDGILAIWSSRRVTICNLSIMLKPEVSQQSLRW